MSKLKVYKIFARLVSLFQAYSIDPDQKEELVSLIEKLLGDRTTLVVGSAVMAFEEVCPERTELIHKQFRKLCHLLVDVEEWGQVRKSKLF